MLVRLSAFVLLALSLGASTITTTTAYGPVTSDECIDGVFDCDPLIFSIPQQQDLTSVSWTIQDSLYYEYGFYNDDSVQGVLVSFTFTEGISSPDLGPDSSISENDSFVNYGNGCDDALTCVLDNYGLIDTSGTGPDVTPLKDRGRWRSRSLRTHRVRRLAPSERTAAIPASRVASISSRRQ